MVNNLFSIKYTIATSIWFTGLLVASFVPASAIDQSFHLFNGEDKVVHVMMYAGLCFLSILASRLEKTYRFSRTITITMLISTALLTEWIQSYIPGRSMSGWDILANMSGIALGLLLLKGGDRFSVFGK